jgi:hypothetical protein
MSTSWMCENCHGQFACAGTAFPFIAKDGKTLCSACFSSLTAKTAPATTRKLIGRVVVDSGKLVLVDLRSSDYDDLQDLTDACLEKMGVGMECEDQGVILNINEDGAYPIYAEFEGDVEPVRFVIELYDEDPAGDS